MSQNVLTIILALITSLSAVTIQSFASRGRNAAEAKQLDAAGEVAQSAEARQWVNEFRQETAAAKAQAQSAEARALSAEEHAEECERRVDDVETKFLKLANYTRALQSWAAGDRAAPPPRVPTELVPPLDPRP